MFGQPSTTSSGVFSGTQNVTTQSKTTSEFCFKPSNEAVFKPIFSASPEPANPQIKTMSSSQTSSSTTSSSLLGVAKSGPLGFNFMQPSAAAQNNQPTNGSSSALTNTLQFTFSQPAVPSSSTSASTTPSSFSFTAKTLQAQPTLPSGEAGFGQTAGFDDNKGKEETGTDERGKSQEDTNVFSRLGKPAKRKEDPATSSSGFDRLPAEDEASIEADSPRHLSKRPLIRSRGLPGNLFTRALSGICKERASTVRRDAVTQKLTPKQEEAVEVSSAPRAAAQTVAREVLEKSVGSGETLNCFHIQLKHHELFKKVGVHQ